MDVSTLSIPPPGSSWDLEEQRWKDHRSLWLWALEFGGGTTSNGAKNELFFTSGPSGYGLGVFGVIKP